MKQDLQNFLEVLTETDTKLLNVEVSSKPSVKIKPLSFKQQKTLMTSGLNGISGVMNFIKSLNDIIIHNSNDTDLKIYDRVPLILALKNEYSSKKINQNDVEIDVLDLINQFKKIEIDEDVVVDGNGFSLKLRIPTLSEENKLISTCIEDMKSIDVENVGKNVSMILSYEIPKFIHSIIFNDKELKFDDISVSDRTKILDNLPANITDKITDYIIKVREYDEQLLTFNGSVIDIDSNFFE